MTVHLYYHDSYLTEFTATVLEGRARGDKHAVVLDRTAFYPTSGGQPHDTGMLGSARVLEVEEDEDGFVLHILDSSLPQGPISGRIDWERRFDHMQQHTGQHILSQAFLKVAQAPTVSFHLGQESCTIDIELAQPDAALMQEAEEQASRVVFEDRPVHVLNVDRSELAALGVRKESQREGILRVIDVADFDRSPCGGTHVRRTGEIGMISVLDFERYKGGTRVEFACGTRVLRTLRKDHEVLKILGKFHSTHPYELPRLVEKLQEERSTLARENSRLEERILIMEAFELTNMAEGKGGKAFVKRRYSDRTIESVKLLAQKIAAIPGAVAILGLAQNGAQVVVAKSVDVPGNCGAAIKEIAARLGGKGGGRPELAQAGGIPESALDSWLDALEQHFLHLLS
jgi:alanyl-tRNA synthetase